MRLHRRTLTLGRAHPAGPSLTGLGTANQGGPPVSDSKDWELLPQLRNDLRASRRVGATESSEMSEQCSEWG